MKETIYSLLCDEKFTDDPTNIGLQRELHSELIQSLQETENEEEFIIGLIYKSFLDDILRNCMEDDYLNNNIVKKSLIKFALSRKSLPNQKWGDLFRDIFNFGKVYKKISLQRKPKDYVYVTVNDIEIKLSIATAKDEIFIGDTCDYPIFFNLDENLSDPHRAKKIIEWYANAVKQIIKQLKKSGEAVDLLCFIEKAYSTVGAVTLMPFLVSELELPATIYRANYWDKNSQISGTKPPAGSRLCFIYDVVISGSALLDANSFFEKNYGVRANSAVVFLDYEKGGDKLAEGEIKLVSCLKYSDIKEEVELKRKVMKKLRALNDTVHKRSYEEQARKVKKIINNYQDSVSEIEVKNGTNKISSR